jgi:MFS family permease
MYEQIESDLGITPLRKNRDFQTFWTSQVLSTLGTSATSVAFPLVVLLETGSAVQAGLVGFAQTLPFLIWFLPAGALVDRLDRKRIMKAAELIRFAGMSSIVVALALGWFNLGHIMAVAFVEGSALVFFELAEAAALPHIVSKANLSKAIAQNQGRQQVANLTGPPLGGLLISVGRSVPFAFDAVSYAISFVALSLIKPTFQETRPESERSLAADIKIGIEWLWRNAFLRTISFLVAVWNFMLMALMLTLIVRARELGGSPTMVGVVTAAFGLGAMGGVFAAARIQAKLRGRTIIVGASLLWAVSLVALAYVTQPWQLAAIVTVAGAASPVFQVMIGRYRYALTPDELQGRMLSASRVIGWGAIPLGSIAAGFSIDAFGATATFQLLAALMAVTVLAAGLSGSLKSDPLKDIEQREDSP